MSARELFTFRNPYFSFGVGVALGLFVLAALGGFIILPYAQAELKFAGLWDAICSAAGLPQRSPSSSAPKPAYPLSQAVANLHYAFASKPGVDRTRCDARPALRDLPRSHGYQSRGFTQSCRPVRERNLQAVCTISAPERGPTR